MARSYTAIRLRLAASLEERQCLLGDGGFLESPLINHLPAAGVSTSEDTPVVANAMRRI